MKTDLKTLYPYYINITDFDGKRKNITIDGYRVIFPEIPEIEFFVHRPRFSNYSWRVSEKKTGFCFPASCDGATRDDAIDKANAKLNKYGIEKFRELYKDVLSGKKDGVPENNV